MTSSPHRLTLLSSPPLELDDWNSFKVETRKEEKPKPFVSIKVSEKHMASRARDEETIVMFPFMAQGHIIPFLSLAFHIEQTTSYRIIFVNTPLNIRRNRPSLPPNTSINLVELPYCSTDHRLPPNSESTHDLPIHLIGRFLESTQSLKPSFNQLIQDITQQQGHPPVCIISDMFLGWTIEVANQLDIFHTIFHTSNAYSMAIFHSLWIHLPHCKTDSDEFSLPDFPVRLHRSQLTYNFKIAGITDSLTICYQELVRLWWKSDGLLVTTIEELDQTGLEYFRAKMGSRPIGTILPTLLYESKRARPQNNNNLEECLQWLDTKPPSSVLYVSFGSQNTISMKQMVELALGLEASGKNFIWVVRPPVGFDINEEFRSEWLPEGFVGRIIEGNRGLIVYKWAPQLEILSHKSTCGFVSHCGWNSTLESLSNGVPIIGWPLSGEQFYNSKMLEEELGVCIEVARGNDSEIKHEEIKTVIELVMGETDKGEEMKKKACEVKEMINNAIRDDEGYKGSCVKAMEDFIKTVESKGNI